VQTSRITTVSQRCIKPDNGIEIKGSFDAKILNIAINGKAVPASQWNQSAELITIKWANNFNSNIEIQIYNGQVPILSVQRLAYVDQCALEEAKVAVPTPTPTPSLTPSPTPTKVVNTQPTAEMKKISMIYFALGSYLVSKPNKVEVTKIAAEIMKSPVKTVLIYGHTDSQGGVDNIALSKNRAKAIVAQIKPLLKGKSIRIGWYAATKPAATGKSKAAYAQNRRVEIWVK
jgi:outer membrane protein OmpA-like peptidoglycan-associated protein